MRALAAVTLFLSATAFSQEIVPDLRMGDKAPAIDIEHWIIPGPLNVTGVTPGDGTIYVLDFWATWCVPCIAEFPHVSELQAKYAEQGVVFVGISDEPLSTVEPFLDRAVGPEGGAHRERMQYAVATDPDRSTKQSVLLAAADEAIPQIVVIGRDGTVQWVGIPTIDDFDSALAAIVEGDWTIEPWRTNFEDRLLGDKRFAAALEAERWADARTMAGHDPERVNAIAARIVLAQPGALQNRDLEFARQCASEALDLADRAMSFPYHLLAAIDFEMGDLDGALAAQREAVRIEGNGQWAGYYAGALAKYEKAVAEAEKPSSGG